MRNTRKVELTDESFVSIYAALRAIHQQDIIMQIADNEKLVIIGLTEAGQKFRPSDWAERLCGSLCTFRNRRMYYSPLLRPAVIDGVKCVVVDSRLAQEQGEMFEYVLGFVKENALKTEIQSK